MTCTSSDAGVLGCLGTLGWRRISLAAGTWAWELVPESPSAILGAARKGSLQRAQAQSGMSKGLSGSLGDPCPSRIFGMGLLAIESGA